MACTLFLIVSAGLFLLLHFFEICEKETDHWWCFAPPPTVNDRLPVPVSLCVYVTYFSFSCFPLTHFPQLLSSAFHLRTEVYFSLVLITGSNLFSGKLCVPVHLCVYVGVCVGGRGGQKWPCVCLTRTNTQHTHFQPMGHMSWFCTVGDMWGSRIIVIKDIMSLAKAGVLTWGESERQE